MSEKLTDLGDGWKGRATATTRVAFHDDGSTVVFQRDGTLMAQAVGLTPAVLAFLFAEAPAGIGHVSTIHHDGTKQTTRVDGVTLESRVTPECPLCDNGKHGFLHEHSPECQARYLADTAPQDGTR